jgi:hypothetical protein
MQIFFDNIPQMVKLFQIVAVKCAEKIFIFIRKQDKI